MKFTWITNVHLVYLYLFISTAHWGILVTYVNLSSLWFQFLFLFLAYVWCLICIYQRTCHLWTLFHSCPLCFLSREHAIIYLIEHTSPFQLRKETKCRRHSAKENKFWCCCLGIETADLLRWMMTLGFPFDVDFLRRLFDSFKGALLSSECPVPHCHILQNWVLFNGLG